MTSATSNQYIGSEKPLRLWPGVVIVLLQWLGRFVVPIFAPDFLYIGVIGAVVASFAVVIWWAFFSRAPVRERWGAIAVIIAAMFATTPLLHKSIATGMMGFMFGIYVIPVLCLALVTWAALSRRFSGGMRWATMVAAVLLACLGWTLVRTDGITGDADSEFAWRWSPTHEEKLLAAKVDKPETASVAPAVTPAAAPPVPVATPATADAPAATPPAKPASADWPGFRGPNRDGVVRGVKIQTDWSASPPAEVWRRPVGPGWSSFAVNGDLLYTQEQRGEEELVSCHNLKTGEPVWTHRDATRFWESNAGAGPRGTPTLSNGRVYTFGATGIVNVLNGADGKVIWSRNAGSDTETKVPMWGFSSSPVVLEGLVIVAAESKLIAYDAATGEPRWRVAGKGGGYSSPHLATFDGVEQVIFLTGSGAIGVSPRDGKQLWEHQWPTGPRIVQPALASGNEILMGGSGMEGMRRIGLTKASAGWSVQERWTSNGLKPYFNDFVVHKGHAFGFDGRILSCIDLKDGTRKWKGGRYGHGQLVLLPDQDLLLVLSEEGELGLVGATSDEFKEIARLPAIEGKTWNHPVLVRDTLLVRNDREMAAFRLSLAQP